MARSKLKQQALDNYKKAPLASWILGLTTGLLIAALLALDFILPSIALFLVPLMILPILFSATIQHAMLYGNRPLTVKDAFRGFGVYFRGNNSGSFSFFKSLLFAIISFISIEMLVSAIASTILQYTNPEFVDSLNAFYTMIQEPEFNLNDFNYVLTMNHYVLLNYFCIVIFPSLYISIIVFIYFITRHALTIYFRFNAVNMNNRFINMIYRDMNRRNRKKLMGGYFSLHWPMFVLLIVGFAGGTVGGFFLRQDLLFVITCGVVAPIILVSFYLPFYFPNQEALFDTFGSEFHKSTVNVTNRFIQTLQDDIDISTEQKEELLKKMSDLTQSQEDNEDDEEK